jgi:hypothetical protein
LVFQFFSLGFSRYIILPSPRNYYFYYLFLKYIYNIIILYIIYMSVNFG